MAIAQRALLRIQDAKAENSIYLDLSWFSLTEFPAEILDLQQLLILNLSHNNLTQVPETIGYMKNLTELDLRSNDLTSLPATILNLRNLRGLYLGHNKIQKLPEPIYNLKNLVALYLENNQISTIPSSIINLRHLVVLNLSDNPLITPPPELAYKGFGPVREYFRQLQETGQERIFEAKLLILGEGGAGKTTLAKKIEDSNYQLQMESSTEGVDVVQWSFTIEGGRQFRVNIWDFGGQEIYHATHQFFLTKRSLYLLVADTRKDDTDFYYWLNIAELLSDNSPLLIVKNERNDRPREINVRQLRAQFENLKDVLSTNLATNRGLDRIKDEIKHYLSKLPHIGSPLPKTWIQVREILETDTRSYISLDEYFRICRDHEVVEREDSLQLSDYLHSVGVILHFQDEPLLRKTVILKPQWGTDAVYKILDNKKVIENLGRFSDNDIQMIWNIPEYEEMHAELLRLMIKFKLCYEIPASRGIYIAPQLLTENQPPYDWDDFDNLLMRYTYEFMPKGILSQFIVIMHAFILEQSYVWRTGVLLSYNDSRAEIIEYYGTREIQIKISGTRRKELMTIILHELDKIHSSYKRLKYSQLIPCNCEECSQSSNPHFYPYKRLEKFITDKQGQIQCPNSYQMVNVRRLIDDVISDDKLSLDRKMFMSQRSGSRTVERSKVFISYSHKDKEWLMKVQTHLKVLENIGIDINIWDDSQIKPGMRWREEIENALSSAKVAILLVSTDFLASDFISKNELPPLLKAAEKDGATILPLLLRPSLFIQHPQLKEFQSVNSPLKPLSTLSEGEQDAILVSLMQRVVELMKEN
jgi:internalin A